MRYEDMEKYRVMAVGRYAVEAGFPLLRPTDVVFSISDPGAPPVAYKGTPHALRRFEFIDTSDPIDGMDAEDAFDVMETLRDMPAGGRVICQCFAGASRSLSLAMAIVDVFGWGRGQVWVGVGYAHGLPPNRHVYALGAIAAKEALEGRRIRRATPTVPTI